jgi:hypothetical protein
VTTKAIDFQGAKFIRTKTVEVNTEINAAMVYK